MSDEIRDIPIEFPCSPCSKVDRRVESFKFCDDCKEYLCELCLKYHERFAATTSHKVGAISKTLVPQERITEVPIPSSSANNASREITGMCTVRRGNRFLLVFTDWYAQLVRVLDLKTHKIIDSVTLESKPYGVIYLPEMGLLAATLRDTGEVVFVQLSDEIKLRIVNYAKVSTSCRGLHVVPGLFNDTVLLTSGGHRTDGHRGSVDICAVTYGPDGGKLFQLKRFSPRPPRRQPAILPKNITVDVNSKKIYVTDGKIGVIVFDKDGSRIGTLSDPSLGAARALCSDADGNVYVGGTASANIVKFDRGGKFLGEITNKRFGLKCPICMCFDETSKSLMVGSKGDHVIRILKL